MRWEFLLSTSGPPWFSDYSYEGEDHGLFKPIRQPACLWLVSFVPMSLAPHALTIAGSAALLPSAIAMAFYAPDSCDTPALAWISVACGVGAIVWDILDNMDGPQARRTKTAGILGDFLDHQLDYISLAIVVYGFLWSIGLGRDPFSVALAAMALAAHECVVYMTWWGRRFTGRVVLGVLSQDEAVVILSAGMFYAATVPPAYWRVSAATLGGVALNRAQLIGLTVVVFLGLGAIVVSGLETLTHKAFPTARRGEALVALAPLAGYLLSFTAAVGHACFYGAPFHRRARNARPITGRYLAREDAPSPSLALTFVAVSAVSWPLGSLQLLSALAGRAPAPLVNLTLVVWPAVMAWAHLQFPENGMLLAALAMHALTIAAASHIAGELMTRVGCPSLWTIPSGWSSQKRS